MFDWWFWQKPNNDDSVSAKKQKIKSKIKASFRHLVIHVLQFTGYDFYRCYRIMAKVYIWTHKIIITDRINILAIFLSEIFVLTNSFIESNDFYKK